MEQSKELIAALEISKAIQHGDATQEQLEDVCAKLTTEDLYTFDALTA